jgi:hypothetical protein
VKSRFQNLPFKFNLQRYTTVTLFEEELGLGLGRGASVGLYKLHQVDP